MVLVDISTTSWINVAYAAALFFLQHGTYRTGFAKWKHQSINKKNIFIGPSSRGWFHETIRLLSIPEPDESANHLVSMGHAIFAIIMGIMVLTLDHRPCGSPLGPMQRVALQLSLGYFIYDLFYELWKHEEKVMIFHHLFACLGLIGGLAGSISGTELVGSIVAAELSTPLLHIRYFLRGKRTTESEKFVFNLVTTGFACIFLLSRCIILGPVITYCSVTAKAAPIIVKSSGSILYIISLYWGAKLVLIYYRKIGKRVPNNSCQTSRMIPPPH